MKAASPPITGMRAGLLGCLCPADIAPRDDSEAEPASPARLAAIAAGSFALSVLVQVLAVSTLPLAGAMLAGRPEAATLPFAALLLGGVVASLPAALLHDAFGRRAAFALGASLGLAGSVLAAWAIAQQQFVILILGAFWIGTAQGFGLAYRHEGHALPPRHRVAATALIFGSGAVAGLLAPVLMRMGETFFAPLPFVGTLAIAALAQGGVLILSILMGAARVDVGDALAATVPDSAGRHFSWRALTRLAAGTAAAWFAMAFAMGAAPAALIGCGVARDGVAGAISWHVLAMYAPALMLGLTLRRLNAAASASVLATGLALAAGGAVAVATGSEAAISLGLVAAGAGWCIATLAGTIRLADLAPSRTALALHDAALFTGALAGALAAAAPAMLR